MKQVRHSILQLLPFLAGFGVLAAYPPFRSLVLTNAGVQAVLFLLTVIWPVARTGRMAYVDVGWPLGLLALGIQGLVFRTAGDLRGLLVSLAYVIMGGRMSLMALVGLRLGYFRKEFPRYEYQRLRWSQEGFVAGPAMMVEVVMQGVANMGILAVPLVLQVMDGTQGLGLLEGAAYGLWLGAILWETVADAQKAAFNQKMLARKQKGAHCEVGLWRWCRHPNYFGEWMVWNALVLASLPSLLRLASKAPGLQSLGVGVSLLVTSYTMYQILTEYSGAVPSEYYSVQKRPGYADYQKRVPRFFPRIPRSPSS